MIPIGSAEAANGPGANIARHLGRVAAAQPHAVALKVPRGRTRTGEIDYLALSFRELDCEVAAWCGRLTAAGIRAGIARSWSRPNAADRRRLRPFQPRCRTVVIDPGMG